MRLGEFLKSEATKKGGLTLRGLARKAKVNESTVWRAKNGEGISLRSATKISKATGYKVRLEDLQQKELDL